MAEVMWNGEKYENSGALSNVIQYYGYGDSPATTWDEWASYGLNQGNLDVAMKTMLKTKKQYNLSKGVQLHQIHIHVSAEELRSTFGRCTVTSENTVMNYVGAYFLHYGLQSICFKYRSKKGIFLRFIVNSVSLQGTQITNIKPFVNELTMLLEQRLNPLNK